MTFPSYSTGTVTVAADGTTATGSGTVWSDVNARAGDLLQIGNFQTIISEVTDPTNLVIPTWGGGAQTSAAYVIWHTSPLRFAGGQAMADVSALVAALNTDGFYVFVPSTATDPDPSYGNDGQYAFQATTGKLWIKSGGVWTFLGIYKAFGLAAPWSSLTAYEVNDVATLAGSSYVCILAHTNHTPPNATYWAVLAAKGDTGATGATGAAGTNGTNGAGYGGTSTTSLLIGTGSKAFTTQAGMAYVVGSRVRAASNANGANYMEGLVTAYSGTTLTVNVGRVGGSGTLADWNLSLAGDPGSGDLLAANNLSELASAATARGNLGVLYPPQGRLCIFSGEPVHNVTRSAKTTIYYTPYVGNQIPLYDGTNMVPTVFSELSVATTDTTKSPAAIGASKVNDWFVWNDAGTIRLSHGPDWTSDTARSVGTALVMVNGILLNNAAITNGPAASRGTYVGTTRSNASSQLDWIVGTAASGGGAGFFGVWNMYNRRLTGTDVTDSGAGYTYTTATIRQTRASAGNQVTFVSGLAEDASWGSYGNRVDTVAAVAAFGRFGLGFDSTTTFAGQDAFIHANTAAVSRGSAFATKQFSPALGVHTISANELGDGVNANTFNITSVANLSVTIWN